MSKSQQAIIVVIVVVLVAIWASRRPSQSPTDLPSKTASNVNDSQALNPQTTSDKKTGVSSIRSKLNKLYSKGLVSDNKAVNLSRAIRLKLDVPYKLYEVDHDLQPDVFLVAGKQEAWGTGLAIAASSETRPVEEVLEFGKELLSYLPENEKLKVASLEAPVVLENSNSRGFKNGTRVSGRLENGEEIHFVYLVREDRNGSYLMVTYGPETHFGDSEEYYDDILSRTSALPANK
jgi:hypothetical protein